jgi:hypothetical protein
MLELSLFMEPNMLKEKIVNVETGEEIIRDYTPEQLAEAEAAQAQAEVKAAELAAKAAARQAVLDKLGLTADEVAALGL